MAPSQGPPVASSSSPPPPSRQSYAAASQPPRPAPQAAQNPQGDSKQTSSSRTKGIATVPPSNFFSSSIPSTSPNTSSHFPPRPLTQRKTTSDRSTLYDGDEELEDADELQIITAPSAEQPRPPPPNPWKVPSQSTPRSSQPNASVVESKKGWGDDDWTTHIESTTSSSSSITLPQTTSVSHENLSDQLPASPPIHLESPSPPIPADSRKTKYNGSASPFCDNDGQWTTPRLLALEGECGGRAGIWKSTAFDFEIADTPEEPKYKAMGEWIDLGSAAAQEKDQEIMEDDEVQDVEVEGQGKTGAVPKKGFRTIQRSELDRIRPHRDLYFCRATLSWCLFAKMPDDTRVSVFPGVELWKFRDMSHYRNHTPAHEAIHSALFEDLVPPLPYPLPPADPLSLLTAAPYTFPSPGSRALGSLKLSFASSTKQRRVLFSTQEFYPSVLGSELWRNLLKTRGENPQPGQTSEQAGAASVNFLWRALDDLLFKGETRALPVLGKTFKKAMPWDDISRDVFISTFGYKLISDESAVTAPSIDQREFDGLKNRQRLLRAWLEMGIWLQDYIRRFPNDALAKRAIRITLVSCKPRLLTMLGDHLGKIDASQSWTTVSNSRSNASSATDSNLDPLAAHYSKLGCTPDLDDVAIKEVYDTQLNVWPAAAADFFDSLCKIATVRNSEAMSTKVVIERSKGAITRSELDNAYSELRLPISDKQFDSLGEDDLIDAFHKRLEEVTHPERKKVLREAMKMITQARKSDYMQAILETLPVEESGGESGMQGVEMEKMDLEKAFKALEVENGMDDETIAMVYQVRKEDAKDDNEKSKMRRALEVIAEERQSEQLLAICREASNAAHIPSVNVNLPVGLTNIANTCYLNSLLQYFFTVRELREAVLAFVINNVGGSNESMNPIRVGGRLVTKAEVERSQRFVILLQTLFHQLIHSTSTAVTPETELAYLALVPSKEESEATAAKGSEDKVRESGGGSADDDDDDDIIIIDPSEHVESGSKAQRRGSKKASPTVLGKRRMEDKEEEMSMSVEPTSTADYSTSTTLDDPKSISSDAEMTEASPLPNLSRNTSSTNTDSSGRFAKRGRSVDQLISTDPTAAQTEGPRNPDAPLEVEKDKSSPNSESLPTISAPQTNAASPPPPLPPRPTLPQRKQTKREELEAEVSNYMAFGRQNDVTECMDNVMFQIEAALQAHVVEGKDESTETLLKRTFYGKNRQKLIFDDPSSISEPIRTRDDPFFSLLVDVPPTSFDRDIYDGLDSVFDNSTVEIEGRSAKRSVTLLDLPPVLQIQLQRVQYDREKGRIFKSNAHLKFPEEVNLGRYVEVDAGDEIGLEKKERTNDLRVLLEKTRTRLAKLEQNVNQAQQLKDALSHFGNVSEELGDLLNPALADDTAFEAQDLENDISSLRKRVEEIRQEITNVWSSGDSESYEICAVFIHRGTASSGHYFIYQRDSRDPERWLKYNDAVITTVNREEVFRETTSDTNAYFLVYCRKDRLDAIESIKREVD